MRHAVLVPALVVLVAMAACRDAATAPDGAISPLAAKGGGTTSSKPLRFTIENIENGFVHDDDPAYTHGECGVRSLLHGGGAGDATLGPSLDWTRRLKCGPRVLGLTVDGADGGTVTNLAIYDLGSISESISGTEPSPNRPGQAGMNTSGKCGLVTYGIESESATLTIEPISTAAPRSWRVSTGVGAKAWCANLGSYVDAPFSLVVEER